MNPLQIKTLLKEFDYDKNNFDTTLDFLMFITNEMLKIKYGNEETLGKE